MVDFNIANLYFPIVAFLIATLLIIMFYYEERVVNTETKYYKGLIIVNFIESILAIVLVIMTTFLGDILALQILHRIDYFLLITWSSLMLIYVYYVTAHNFLKKDISKIFVKIVIIINILLFLLISISNLVIINENGIIDTAGPAASVIEIGTTIYIVAIVLFVFVSAIKDKKLNNPKYFPLYTLIGLSIVMVLIRSVRPEIVLVSFVMAFVNLIMYHTIENPDVKMIKKISMAKDHAEKANMAKSDFLSSMSHEIRTPLNAIKGFSELTVETTDIHEANENAKEVVRATETLLEIINGVLDISRIESGNMELHQVDYNPVELFNDTSRMINVRMKEKGLDFRVNIAKDIPSMLYGDKVNIQKVLINLLTNAVKYTNEGHVLLDVQCINKTDKCTLVISIEDTGRGIKPEQIKTLFNKWERLEEDKNTTVEGTGLGLAITEQLLEMMNGKIVVQSIYGSGSKFMVTLNQEIKNPQPNAISVYHPEKKSMTKTLEEPVEVPSTEPVPVVIKRTYPDKKVLIVDDNNLNLKIAERVLKTYELEVVAFSNAHDVLEHINRGEKYDLLLVDDMMPKMTGTEMMKNLKAKGYPVPMVVLTANVMSGEHERYIKEGFHDYLGKPINKDELNRVLNTYLHTEEEIETI